MPALTGLRRGFNCAGDAEAAIGPGSSWAHKPATCDEQLALAVRCIGTIGSEVSKNGPFRALNNPRSRYVEWALCHANGPKSLALNHFYL